MKKKLSKKIALGVCSAAFMSAQVLAFADSMPQQGQMSDMPMTSDEQSFYDKLSSSAKDAFKNMDHEMRAKAMKMPHDCKGKNSCKGQGGSKGETGSCMGQNSCSGKGGCAVTPDKAVQMANKRSSM